MVHNTEQIQKSALAETSSTGGEDIIYL